MDAFTGLIMLDPDAVGVGIRNESSGCDLGASLLLCACFLRFFCLGFAFFSTSISSSMRSRKFLMSTFARGPVFVGFSSSEFSEEESLSLSVDEGGAAMDEGVVISRHR